MASITIQANDFVMIRKGESLHLVQLIEHRPIFISKHKVNISNAIGKPYGSYFAVKNGDEISYLPRGRSDVAELSTDDLVQKDNRTIYDDGNSQKLSKDDIEEFKAQGLTGSEIIENLVENSTSFKDKSLFSQAKYLKKKNTKYVVVFQILMPNTRLLVEMYHLGNPAKVCNVGMDTLSQMLSYCNVMSGTKCLVLDGIQGLLAAAVAERLGGNGCVVHVYPEPAPTSTYRQAVGALNLPKSHLQSLVLSIQFEEALSALNLSQELSNNCHPEAHQNDLQRFERKLERIEMQKKAKEILQNRDMDCLLVASRYHPLNTVCLLDFVANSRPFAVLGMSHESLVECYCHLKDRKNVINMDITESFLRHYQVLPDRTHPHISDNCSSCYLLTGVKVENGICPTSDL